MWNCYGRPSIKDAVLLVPKIYAMKALGGDEVNLPAFFIL
jgi:hypothetical protein